MGVVWCVGRRMKMVKLKRKVSGEPLDICRVLEGDWVGIADKAAIADTAGFCLAKRVK
jgi:hypothetical protein